jgi:amino acid transporter
MAMSGGPILVLVAYGEVAVLAEVASFLHLIMYGLICVSLLAIRRDEPEWYDPDFRVPAATPVAGIGALTSFGMIAFMQPISRRVGAAIMIASGVWYKYYASDVALKGVL